MQQIVLQVLKEIFDADWYMTQDTHIGRYTQEDDILQHFLEIGLPRLRSPHPLFATAWYARQESASADGLIDGLDPFSHYVLVGSRTGTWPHALFDPNWYEQRYQMPHHAIALVDFIQSPAGENRSPHSMFDAHWYRATYMSPRSSHQHAIMHFVKEGVHAGYRPNRWGVCLRDDLSIHVDQRPYKLAERPLVSILIVNLNGASFLNPLFVSLKRQTYQNFEIIFVDNGSRDESRAIFQHHFAKGTCIALPENLGFAKANNIGLDKARGELIALLNNDTVVSDHWLEELVKIIKQDPNIGAACPKIRFQGSFVHVELSSEASFAVDLEALVNSLDYKKYFVRLGETTLTQVRSFAGNGRHALSLYLPVQPSLITLKLESSEIVELRRGNLRPELVAAGREVTIMLDLGENPSASSFHVINNAGGCEPVWLGTCDRGMGEKDDGQFDAVADVELLCGCSALVRRDALMTRALFVSEFGAYFEDSELSVRLRREGFTVRYCPTAIVYHHHSATSQERSDFWYKHVLKNKFAYLYRLSDRPERQSLRDQLAPRLETFLEEVAPLLPFNRKQNLLGKAAVDAKLHFDQIDAGLFEAARKPRIGIFNQYWLTYGGGEAHALAFASFLARDNQVELIGIQDFDVAQMCAYFHVAPLPFIKRLVHELTPSVTREYDVFINSSFMNHVPSEAKHSFYIVSFPGTNPSPEFLRSYKFIANSKYTRRWMRTYWGEVNDVIVHPSVDGKLNARSTRHKERVILSVGRFFSFGHSKNQLEIVNAFRSIHATESIAEGWRLVLVGSVSKDGEEYLREVQQAAHGLPCEIISNAEFSVLKAYYERASIYVHAAGLGKDSVKAPADFEHFGMTVAEAIVNGCRPIVFDAAGPAEVVDECGIGWTFHTAEEMAERMLEAIRSHEDGAVEVDATATRLFSREAMEAKLVELFQDVPIAT